MKMHGLNDEDEQINLVYKYNLVGDETHGRPQGASLLYNDVTWRARSA